MLELLQLIFIIVFNVLFLVNARFSRKGKVPLLFMGLVWVCPIRFFFLLRVKRLSLDLVYLSYRELFLSWWFFWFNYLFAYWGAYLICNKGIKLVGVSLFVEASHWFNLFDSFTNFNKVKSILIMIWCKGYKYFG